MIFHFMMIFSSWTVLTVHELHINKLSVHELNLSYHGLTFDKELKQILNSSYFHFGKTCSISAFWYLQRLRDLHINAYNDYEGSRTGLHLSITWTSKELIIIKLFRIIMSSIMNLWHFMNYSWNTKITKSLWINDKL